MADAKKLLYHSELVGLSPVAVDILSNPTASKFKGRPDYVQMRIDGQTRNYNVENAHCGDVLNGLKGRKVMLEAAGSRDEATLKIVSQSRPAQDTEPEPERRPEQKSATRTSPPADTPTDNFQEERKAANRIANVYLLAFDTALYCKKEIKELHGIDIAVGSEDFRSIVSTIVIRMGYDGDHKFMPTGLYSQLKNRK